MIYLYAMKSSHVRCTTDLSMSLSPNPTIKSPPPHPSVIMSEVEEEERGEAVREKGLSTEGKSDGEPPVTQTKMALAVPAAEAAPTKTEVSGHRVLGAIHLNIFVYVKLCQALHAYVHIARWSLCMWYIVWWEKLAGN